MMQVAKAAVLRYLSSGAYGRACVPIGIRNTSYITHDATSKMVMPEVSILKAKVSEAEMKLSTANIALTTAQTELATATGKANNLQAGTAEHILALKAVGEAEASVAKTERTVLMAEVAVAKAERTALLAEVSSLRTVLNSRDLLNLANVQFPSTGTGSARTQEIVLGNLREHRGIMSASSSVTSTPDQCTSRTPLRTVLRALKVPIFQAVSFTVVYMCGAYWVHCTVKAHIEDLTISYQAEGDARRARDVARFNADLVKHGLPPMAVPEPYKHSE